MRQADQCATTCLVELLDVVDGERALRCVLHEEVGEPVPGSAAGWENNTGACVSAKQTGAVGGTSVGCAVGLRVGQLERNPVWQATAVLIAATPRGRMVSQDSTMSDYVP